MLSALDAIHRPSEPVSTTMPSIVWQFVDEPGAHTVTLTNASLNPLLTGPPFTTIATVLFVVLELLDEPHCGDDTCAAIRSVPTISRRGTVI